MRKFYLLILTMAACISGYAQTVTSYSFAASTTTFTSISSTGTAATAAIGDDVVETGIPVGFYFNFCGGTYNTISANSNGYISLANSTEFSGSFGNATTELPNIASGVGVLMPFWDDLVGNATTSSAWYQTSGTAPYRTFTFEWNNYSFYSYGGESGTGTFQVILYESTGQIDFVYGPGGYAGMTATVGITSSTSDYLTLPNTSSSPTPTTAFVTTLTNSPSPNQVYSWYPCTGTPNGGTVTASATAACTSFSPTLTATGYTYAYMTAYEWQTSTDSATWTYVTGATSTSYTPTVASGTVYYRFLDSCITSGVTGYSAGIALSVLTTPTVGAISGPASVCTGATISLADGTPGGTWSSTAAGVASVDASGTVTGTGGGTADISYTVTNICGSAAAGYSITVNPSPDAGTISGPSFVCGTGTISLSETAGGGSWSSSSASTATVSSSGVVTGVSSGLATITYSVTSSFGCGSARSFYDVSVVSYPVAGTISGSSTACSGTTTTVTASGGTSSPTWYTLSTAICTIDASGNVTYVAPGLATIIDVAINSCGSDTSRLSVTVSSASIPTISGPGSICQGATGTVTPSITGGTWTSATTGVATVTTSGVATGVSSGSAILSYALSESCGMVYTTYGLTVLPLPDIGSISGPTAACIGGTISLSDATGASGGTWSSASTGVATVTGSGVVTGVATGSAIISYSVTNSCGTLAATQSVTVISSAVVSAISGGSFLCAGATLSLTDAYSGGTWTTSAPGVATVDAGGNVTGVSAGTANITYMLTASCGSDSAIQAITVGASPTVSAISGVATLCSGTTATLTDASSGGVWSSHSSAIASIDPSSGTLTGVSAGATTITYTITTSCGSAATLHSITVNSIPSAGTITGSTGVCPGHTITLADATTGGSWTSGATTYATITSGGVVTGVAAGTTIISYAVSGPCGTGYATAAITVNPDPAPGHVTGPDSVCVGATIALVDTSAGGTWMTGAAAIATVDASGNVTGVSADTVNVIYSATTVCGTAVAAHTIRVIALPVAGTVSGATHVCAGSVEVLTASVSSPHWNTTNNTIATVSSGGVIRAVSAGIDTIYHYAVNGCGVDSVAFIDTIDGRLHAGSLGAGDTVCEGDSIQLTPAIIGGTWSTGNANASVSATGMVTGLMAGTDTLNYAVLNTCGTSSATVSLYVRPSGDCTSGLGTVSNNNQSETMVTYPNPNNGSFKITITSPRQEVVTLTCTNPVGQKVKESAITTNKESDVVIPSVPGIYFLAATVNDKMMTTKVIVQ